jgi:hypothetical protein
MKKTKAMEHTILMVRTCLFPYLSLWELGRMTMVSTSFRKVAITHFNGHKRHYFTIEYDTTMNVAGYNVIKKAFDRLLDPRTWVGSKDCFNKCTMSECIGYLYEQRVYHDKTCFMYIPESNDPNLEGKLVYNPTNGHSMQVWGDSEDDSFDDDSDWW